MNEKAKTEKSEKCAEEMVNPEAMKMAKNRTEENDKKSITNSKDIKVK